MNSKQKSVLTGAILGAALGAVGGYLFTRGLDLPRERGEQIDELSLKSVPPGEMVKVFIAIMAVLRGIAELGERL
ncbi:MAG: hypothetical protein PVH95_01210 [Anaerolineae bacterium]|jgi:hypothetical protein